MKTSLIFTVKDEEMTIQRLLEAIDAQSQQPDEIVVIDGGSSDSTLEALRQWASWRPSVIIGSSPGANIATGRNLAIAKAAGPIIAVTDAGCVPEPDWLEHLVAPFSESGPQVVMGAYQPDARSRFERVSSCLNIPQVRQIKAEKYMPSSRSVAFLKSIWVASGGYPEWLDIGEDMFFNFTLRAIGAKRQFAPGAVVLWRPRPNLRSFWRSHVAYARGDAMAGMYLYRHVLRFSAYAAMAGLTGVWIIAPVWLLAPLGLMLYWLLPAYRRAASRLGPGELLLAVPALPALLVLSDFAKMRGYLSGLFRMLTRRDPDPPRAAR